LNKRRGFWPLSDRQIHYALLNEPPLRHTSKPGSVYSNDHKSYKNLTDLLTRARVAGDIPWACIADETRPVTICQNDHGPQDFVRRELDGFLKGYRRDYLQSQPNHVEVFAEKLTVKSIVEPVVSRYGIPLTIGRGYSSSPPRYEMAERFRRSGREKLIVLVISDFDPDGENIAQSFARSIRDDFGVYRVEAFKVALTAEQVADFNLPPVMKAKAGSSTINKFVRKHGDDVFELEALPPAELQRILTEAIDTVVDTDSFNRELEAERQDSVFLNEVRQRVNLALRSTNLGEGGD
jgi:hypothetical protein